jgi:replicative DNA helicase
MRDTTRQNASRQDQLPPHSIEAEQGVLGCVLLSPDCLEECLDKLKAGRLTFYDIRHQTVFSTLAEMHRAEQAIDLITIQQWLKNKQQIEGAGGLGYISSLSDAVPSANNLQYYLDIILEKYRLRKIVQTWVLGYFDFKFLPSRERWWKNGA